MFIMNHAFFSTFTAKLTNLLYGHTKVNCYELAQFVHPSYASTFNPYCPPTPSAKFLS